MRRDGVGNQSKNGITMPKALVQDARPRTEEACRTFYRADSTPSLIFSFFFGLQQVMVSVSVLVSIPFIITDEVCPGRDKNELRVRLISGTFVVCGIATILQTSLGMRLALLQGVALAYIPSMRAFMALPEYHCNANATDDVLPQVYENKMALLQGTLLASSTVTMLIGATGIVGRMTKCIGPLTVSSLMMLLMLSSVQMCVERMETHWISVVMGVILLATVLYLARVKIPLPIYSDGRLTTVGFNLFGQYPYLVAISISWIICWLLTVTELIPANSVARTDRNDTITTLQTSPWFRIPTIGTYGAPRFNLGLFVGYLVSAQTTLFEAIGNYHAVARISDERPPPSHALNRGIISEGLGCFISGLIGPGVGITTHAENVGVIGITGVASRATMVLGGVTLILFGVCTKLGALLSSIPDPLVGVALSSSMAMVGGVAVANAQAADMRQTRNIAILGFSIMLGMVVPTFYARNQSIVNTGYQTLDQILKVLMGLPMFVGAFTACILDNTVGGVTRAQRGLRERGLVDDLGASDRDVYAFPGPLMRLIRRVPVLEILPFIPKKKRASSQVFNSTKNVSTIDFQQ